MGRHALVIGTPARGTGAASLRDNQAYRARSVNQAFNRAGIYFDFRGTDPSAARLGTGTGTGPRS